MAAQGAGTADKELQTVMPVSATGGEHQATDTLHRGSGDDATEELQTQQCIVAAPKVFSRRRKRSVSMLRCCLVDNDDDLDDDSFNRGRIMQRRHDPVRAVHDDAPRTGANGRTYSDVPGLG